MDHIELIAHELVGKRTARRFFRNDKGALELIEAMSNTCRDYLLDDVKTSPAFSVMHDTSTDIGSTMFMTVSAVFLEENRQV